MILDTLQNASLYHGLGSKFVKAFEYLTQTDFSQVEKGKYELEGTDIFALVNEYDTVAASDEKMESHIKHIDIQYMVYGEELIGHDFLEEKLPSKDYDEEKDYMLFSETPAFFTKLKQGYFAIFFPTDLHMPNLMVNGSIPVKKVVIKLRVE